MRLQGEDRDFEPIRNKDGTFRKNLRKELRNFFGPNSDETDKEVEVGWDKVKKDKILQESILNDPNSTEEQIVQEKILEI